MCITFFHLDPDAKGNYRLILAMNRDEAVGRTTERCQWKGDHMMLAGRDLTPGKEGGTWLGMDRHGRIGILTNIATGSYEKEGKGRGHLIPDYLKSPLKPSEFLESLHKSEDVYNPFNLLLIDLQDQNHGEAACYTRGKPGHVIQTESPTLLDFKTKKIFGLSNSPLGQPFLKTTAGEKTFRALVEEYNDPRQKEANLLAALIRMMSDPTRHDPDPQMALQGGDPKRTALVSSIFVDIPGIYGTRMQSVILVDSQNKAVFLERTKTEGKDGLGEWTETRHDFDLDL